MCQVFSNFLFNFHYNVHVFYTFRNQTMLFPTSYMILMWCKVKCNHQTQDGTLINICIEEGSEKTVLTDLLMTFL